MIRIATKQAAKSSFERYKLGAVIVKGNRVLSTGYNEIRYSSELRKSNIHAEEAAVLKLLKENRLNDLNGSTIYVSRIRANLSLGCSRPCINCYNLIRSVGIDKMVYINEYGKEESIKC